MLKIIIYLDYTTDFDILRVILKKENFKVISSINEGITTKDIDLHLMCATKNSAIILTENKDFLNIKTTNHHGILIIYRFNDPKNIMTVSKIITSLKNIKNQEQFSMKGKILPLNLFTK